MCAPNAGGTCGSSGASGTTSSSSGGSCLPGGSNCTGSFSSCCAGLSCVQSPTEHEAACCGGDNSWPACQGLSSSSGGSGTSGSSGGSSSGASQGSIICEPDPIDFGIVDTGTPVVTVTCTNETETTLSIDGIGTESGAPPFSEASSAVPFAVAPGANFQVTVEFQSDGQPGVLSDDLDIVFTVSGDPSISPRTFVDPITEGAWEDGGSASTCPTGEMLCNGSCVNPSTDPANCGGCAGDGGRMCPLCGSWGCGICCGGMCGLRQGDPANCGGCGIACPAGEYLAASIPSRPVSCRTGALPTLGDFAQVQACRVENGPPGPRPRTRRQCRSTPSTRPMAR